MQTFPRYNYTDYHNLKDAIIILQNIFNEDIIRIIINLYTSSNKKQDSREIQLNYLNIQKHWHYLDSLSQEKLDELYYKVKTNKKVTIYYSETVIPNNKYKIESISKYERENIKPTSIKRTKSCSDIPTKELDNLKKYKKIWTCSDEELSDIYYEMKQIYYAPLLYYWPDITNNLDEKNKYIIREYISNKYIVRNIPEKITKSLISEYVNTV